MSQALFFSIRSTLALICTLGTCSLHGQEYAGQAKSGFFFGYAGILDGIAHSDWTVNYDGTVFPLQATLTPGHLQFNAYDISLPPFTIDHTFQQLDPMTFRTETYQVHLSIDAFTYTSSSQAFPLSVSGGTLLTAGGTGGWLADPARITGSFTIQGPVEQVSGLFGVDLTP